MDAESVHAWFDGRFVGSVRAAAALQGSPSLLLGKGDKARGISIAPLRDSLMVSVDIQGYANDRFSAVFAEPRIAVGGVPFELSGTEQNCLSLAQAEWPGWQQDLPWSHESPAPRMLNDPRMPVLRVPAADYVAAHVLAVAEDDPGRVPALTLRAGRLSTNGNEPNVQYDFPARVPRRGEAANVDAKARVQTAAGPLFYVRVPMTLPFAQDFGGFLEIEGFKPPAAAG